VLPETLHNFDIQIENNGTRLIYKYDVNMSQTGVTAVLAALNGEGVSILDLQTYQSSLEDIFVGLVAEGAA
jgi:ABC-2 type transport system ATP-binding protein